MRRWIMSYAQVYQHGRVSLGHNVYESDEHPVAKVKRWTETHGAKDKFRVILLSFQEVGPDCPLTDELSNCLGG